MSLIIQKYGGSSVATLEPMHAVVGRVCSRLAATVFSTLGSAGIPIDMVTTSQVRISCLVPESHVLEATRLLHSAFALQDPFTGGLESAQLITSGPNVLDC